jgi:hypothetical protein
MCDQMYCKYEMFEGRIYDMCNDAHVQIAVCKPLILVPESVDILLLPICLNLYTRRYFAVK